MAKIVETEDTLHVEIGMPKFNGSIVDLDREAQTARIQITNLFIKSKPVEIALSDITELRLMGSQSAAYPRIVVKSGKSYNLASFSSQDAVEAVQRMQAFLAGPSA